MSRLGCGAVCQCAFSRSTAFPLLIGGSQASADRAAFPRSASALESSSPNTSDSECTVEVSHPTASRARCTKEWAVGNEGRLSSECVRRSGLAFRCEYFCSSRAATSSLRRRPSTALPLDENFCFDKLRMRLMKVRILLPISIGGPALAVAGDRTSSARQSSIPDRCGRRRSSSRPG